MSHVISASVVGVLASVFVAQGARRGRMSRSPRSKGFLLTLLRLALASVLVAAIQVSAGALGAYPLAPIWQGGRWLWLLGGGLVALALLALTYRWPALAPDAEPPAAELAGADRSPCPEACQAKRTRAAASGRAAAAPRSEILSAERLPTSTLGALKFSCPRCGYRSKVLARYAGVAALCAGCREPLRVPACPPGQRSPQSARRSQERAAR